MDIESPIENLKRLQGDQSGKENEDSLSFNKKKKSAIEEIAGEEGKSPISFPEVTGFKFWMGFQVMEELSIEEGLEELFGGETVEDMVTWGFKEKEAWEVRQARIAFLHIPQLFYPISRGAGGMGGQHYNITQVPTDILVDEHTGLALDFQVAIHFELPTTPLLHNEVKEMVVHRLKSMDIALGKKIIDPISIHCLSVKKGGGQKGVWSGLIKLHLLKPEIDGLLLLKGIRPFILKLDEVDVVGKVCKAYNSIARNTNLSVKILGSSLHGVTANHLFKEILESSFRRNQDFEVTNVQKRREEGFAFIMATTPQQAKKIEALQVTAHQEVMQPQKTSGGGFITKEKKAKKDALTLTLSPLPILMNLRETSTAIHKIIGASNVCSIYYHRHNGSYHNGSANVECTNPIVYRAFVDKTIPIGGHFVEFAPHRRSLEGVEPPTQAQIMEFGFGDVNKAIVNTVEAFKLQEPSQAITKKDLMEAFEANNAMLRQEAKEIAEIKAKEFEEFKSQMLKVQECVGTTFTMLQEITGSKPPSMLEDGLSKM